MANRDAAPHQLAGAAVVVAVVPGRRDAVLDAARVLMLYGVVGAVATTVGNGDAGQAVGGLVLWLLGVCLLAFVQAAGRFPRAALGAAAVGNAALGQFFAPGN